MFLAPQKKHTCQRCRISSALSTLFLNIILCLLSALKSRAGQAERGTRGEYPRTVRAASNLQPKVQATSDKSVKHVVFPSTWVFRADDAQVSQSSEKWHGTFEDNPRRVLYYIKFFDKTRCRLAASASRSFVHQQWQTLNFLFTSSAKQSLLSGVHYNVDALTHPAGGIHHALHPSSAGPWLWNRFSSLHL